MGTTLAIHWAATTHGMWLHGDPRGSWHNGRLVGPDPYLEAATRASLAADAVVLSTTEREIVAKAFGEVIREQGHRVYAATVQETHVHLIFAPLRENLANVVARFKRRSTMAVHEYRQHPARMAGLYSRAILARQSSLWTAGKFPVFIFDQWHLANAIEYVRDHNRPLGLPADPFDWIEPLYAAGDSMGERVHRRSLSEELPF